MNRCLHGFLVRRLSEFATVHCLAPLDIGTGVEQLFDCLIVQNRQAMQSMWRSMGWTLDDITGRWFAFLRQTHRPQKGHTPFV